MATNFKEGEVQLSCAVQDSIRRRLRQMALAERKTFAQLVSEILEAYIERSAMKDDTPCLSNVMRDGLADRLIKDGADADTVNKMTDGEMMHVFQCNAVGQALNDVKDRIRKG